MAKSLPRSYSRYTHQALKYLGGMVRAGRIEKQMQAAELADRAGISRDMLYRIEKGDPRCEVGVVFELAAIVGMPLFEEDFSTLQSRNHALDDRLALLPKAVHKPRPGVKDDF